MAQNKYILSERDIPKSWYNVIGDLPVPLPPPLHPGTGQPIGPQDLERDISHAAHRAGGIWSAQHPDTGPDSRCAAFVAADSAVSRAPAGEGARHTRAHFLQARRRFAVGQPQDEHLGGPGVLQQSRGHQAAGDRDRRRTMGKFAGFCLQYFRSRVHGVHGEVQLLPEAASPHHDGDLGSALHSFAQRSDRGGTADAGRRPGMSRQLGDRHQRGGGGRRGSRGHKLLAGKRVESRSAPSDHHRAGSRRADEDGGSVSRTS